MTPEQALYLFLQRHSGYNKLRHQALGCCIADTASNSSQYPFKSSTYIQLLLLTERSITLPLLHAPHTRSPLASSAFIPLTRRIRFSQQPGSASYTTAAHRCSTAFAAPVSPACVKAGGTRSDFPPVLRIAPIPAGAICAARSRRTSLRSLGRSTPSPFLGVNLHLHLRDLVHQSADLHLLFRTRRPYAVPATSPAPQPSPG